jgi:hypothetical protein
MAKKSRFYLKNKKVIDKALREFGERAEKAIIFNMEALVAELENHAKLSAGYEDQTSNLKGSIGGAVLKDGKPISYKGFDSGGSEGRKTGLEYINSLITLDKSKGYVIIIVAGMEYAAYVEDIHNLNVLKKSELKMKRELPKMLNRMKRKLEQTKL